MGRLEHHRWLVDVVDGRLRFAMKPGVRHHRDHFGAGHVVTLSDEQRVMTFWWEGAFEVEELQFVDPEELHRYLRGVSDGIGLVSGQGVDASLLRGARRAIVRQLRRGHGE